MRIEWLLGIRYLCSAKRGFASLVSFFSFLGICLGVATLIVVTAVMNGFSKELLGKLIGIKGHVFIYGKDGTIASDLFAKNLLVKNNAISHIFPVIERQGVLMAHGQARGLMIRGMDPKDLIKRPILDTQKIPRLTKNDILLGKRLFDALYLTPGEMVNILIPDGRITPVGVFPKTVACRVVGFFEVGMHEYDKNFAYTSLVFAQELFNLPGKITQGEVFLKDAMSANGVKKDLVSQFPGCSVLDWKHADHALFQAVEVEKQVMFVILTLIVIIASFNIISSMTMLVKDKYKTIGILRTVGASRLCILKIFMICGLMIGVSGTFLGTLLGVFVARHLEAVKAWINHVFHLNLFNPEVYFLSKLPVAIIPSEVGVIVGVSLMLTFLSSFYPAWRASQLDPVDILRS